MARLLIFSLVCSLLSVPARAVDPLQPPPGFGVAGAGVAAAEEQPVLQSVLLSAQRKIALINGRSIPLGGRFGSYRLIELDARSAVLQGPQGRLKLYLMPAMNPLAPARAALPAPTTPGARRE